MHAVGPHATKGRPLADLPQPVTARGEATRRKLLEAAEAEFGENGFHTSSVSSITGRAGVAQGTFYLYFPCKEDILRELVRSMGRKLRRRLSKATAVGRDRIEIEQLGLEAFVAFSLEHGNLYRVVMESQFVNEEIYREYYTALASAYAAGLRRAQERLEVKSGDPEALAWALMGIAHFLGLRYAIWEKQRPPAQVLETLHSFIGAGLRPARGEP